MSTVFSSSSPKKTLLHFLRTGVFIWMIIWPLILLGFWLCLPNLPESWITQFSEIDLPQYTVTPSLPWIGAAVSLLPIAIHLLLCLNLMRLLNIWLTGNVFSEQTTSLFSKLSLLYLFRTVSDVLMNTLYPLLLTMGNPPGQRILNLGISSIELSGLGAAGFLYILAFIMKQAHMLQQEADLTI